MRGIAPAIVGSAIVLSCWGCASLSANKSKEQAALPENAPSSANAATGAAPNPAWQPQPPVVPVAAPAPAVANLAAKPIVPVIPPPSQDQAVALEAAIAELRTLGAIDPAVEAQLRADLQQTDPALWPRLLQYFRAARNQKQPDVQLAQSPPKPPAELIRAPAGPAKAPTVDPSNALPAEAPLPIAVKPNVSEPVASNPEPVAASSPAELKAPAPTEPPPEPVVAAPQPVTEPKPKLDTVVPVQPTPAQSDAEPPKPAESKVVPASLEVPEETLSWKDHLDEAIRGMEADSTAPPATTTDIARHANLRMLYLAAGRREDALRPISGIPPAQQDFWSNQVFGLATYLDGEKITDSAQRASAAKEHMNNAVLRLGEMGTLVVRNMAFCTKVSSYGVFTKFDTDAFKPGEEVLLYAEVENFRSESTDEGYHTVLRSSYQILDNRGQRVDQREFSTTEEYCQNPRRDFFIRYFLHMPQRIYDGKYTLQLTIEDTLSQKIGQASIEFSVKGAQE